MAYNPLVNHQPRQLSFPGVWAKFHLKTEQGIKNLPSDAAASLAGMYPFTSM